MSNSPNTAEELKFSKCYTREKEPNNYQFHLYFHARYVIGAWKVDPISLYISTLSINDLSWMHDCYNNFIRSLPRIKED